MNAVPPSSSPDARAAAFDDEPLRTLLQAYRASTATSGAATPFAAFAASLAAPFAALLASPLVIDTLDRLLAAIAGDPLYRLPDLQVADDQIGGALFDGFDALRVTLAEDPRGATRHVSGAAAHRLIGVLTGDVLCQRFTHLADAEEPDLLNPRGPLARAPELQLRPGEFVALEAWRDVATFSGRGLLLTLASPACHATRWSYSRDTLQPAALRAADPRWRRLEQALELLGRIGTPQHAAVCEPFLRHLSPDVRRAAERTASALTEASIA